MAQDDVQINSLPVVSDRSLVYLQPLRNELPPTGYRVATAVERQHFEGITGTVSWSSRGCGISEVLDESRDVVDFPCDAISYRCIEAVHKLMNRTDQFAGSLGFTPASYLEACDVRKRRTGRGKMEFVSGDRERFMRALWRLAEQPVRLRYRRLVQAPSGRKWEGADVTGTLWTVTAEWRCGAAEISPERRARTNTIWLSLHPIFYETLENDYIFKHWDWQRELVLVSERYKKQELERCSAGCRRRKPERLHLTTRLVSNLMLYVRNETAAAHSRREKANWEIKRSEKKLAEVLRLEPWLSARQGSRVRAVTEDCLAIAKEAGWIERWKPDRSPSRGCYRIQLAPSKFKTPKGQRG